MFSKNLSFLTSVFIIVCCIIYACKTLKTSPQPVNAAVQKTRLLVFTRTKGFYHESIPEGSAAVIALGSKNNFSADTTTNAAYFNLDTLKNYSAVMFLNTTMNVLNSDQQVAFERYIQAGGGFIGIHSATDTEYDWPWYNRLVGAQFASHPKQQKAIIRVTNKHHPATSFLPDSWERFDEWYNFKNVQADLNVLAYVDETSYEGGEMGDSHPYAWYHEFDGGRAFYTAGGHTKESYSDSLFLKHILGGIQYAIGNGKPLDFSKSYSVKSPEDNRFTKTILSDDLNEPMELAVAPDGRVFFTERAGKFYVYEPSVNKTRLLYDFPVKAVDKYLNGLIGVTLDPDFTNNNYIYFFYTSKTSEQYHQNISRFKITAEGNLDTTSEKIIIKVPIDLEVSAHTGGSLAWDRQKNLYISTGDNTVPFESDGYSPMDEREGRKVFDAQRSAGNSNDLRGKILRIHPEEDGSYTIPEGNLFPKGTAGTRPEIYVMGCRNPYRISVDTANSILYWGEVGPDAGRDSRHGPKGYDEFNQAKKAGYYGWPYFVGNNKAYSDSNFATHEIGAPFNVNGPENPSPNNTGLKLLPPPQLPMIWYPYSPSPEFPILGNGGRCAMGGPVYHYNESLTSSGKLPAYYDKALFVYDWMRNWVFAVRMDENMNYKYMEPFMATNGDFRRPVDIEIGKDGAMYMLEYGSVYGIDNVDARLVKITYNSGNRQPVAKIIASDSTGTAPFTVKLNGDKSYDYDDDALTYEWSLDGKVFSSANKAEYTFDKNGIYNVVLKVQDAGKKSSTDTMKLIVGNTPPQVKIATVDNSTFFFNFPSLFRYDVQVKDKEDGEVRAEKIQTTIKYISRVAGGQNEPGHQVIDANYNLGKILIAGSDCKACHQVNAKSVGPSFMDVSRKYVNDKNAPGYLANKVITGGAGVWGEHGMSAHPQLSKEDATEMVKYVLSIINEQKENILPGKDSITLSQHIEAGQQGRYIVTSSYTDNGNGVMALTGKDMLVLRPALIKAVNADRLYNLDNDDGVLSNIKKGSYFVLKNIDLKDIHHIIYYVASAETDAGISVHVGSPKGKLISSGDFKPTDTASKFEEVAFPVSDPGGKNDLYFVFGKKEGDKNLSIALDWIRFEGGKEVAVPKTGIKKQGKQKQPLTNDSTGPGEVKAGPKPDGKKLMAQSDCMTCHSMDKKIIGPSYADIANRYKGDNSTLKMLSQKIIAGGSGSWGNIPMTPHPKLSKKDASVIVSYILSLKKGR